MLEKIRLFYAKKLWPAAMVRQALGKGLLTEAEYAEILGGTPGTAEGTEVEADG